MLEKAREFAIAAHGDQPYGTQPYVVHLSSVVSVLEHFGYSDNHLIAGWLHDVVEDTSATRKDVKSAFGERVAELVWGVTGEGHGDRRAHSESIYRKIAVYPDAAPVKLADRIANIEACHRGDTHSVRYAREHADFAQAVEPHVPTAMWERYLRALADRRP